MNLMQRHFWPELQRRDKVKSLGQFGPELQRRDEVKSLGQFGPELQRRDEVKSLGQLFRNTLYFQAWVWAVKASIMLTQSLLVQEF